jgi:hypothetical protein
VGGSERQAREPCSPPRRRSVRGRSPWPNAKPTRRPCAPSRAARMWHACGHESHEYRDRCPARALSQAHVAGVQGPPHGGGVHRHRRGRASFGYTLAFGAAVPRRSRSISRRASSRCSSARIHGWSASCGTRCSAPTAASAGGPGRLRRGRARHRAVGSRREDRRPAAVPHVGRGDGSGRAYGSGGWANYAVDDIIAEGASTRATAAATTR